VIGAGAFLLAARALWAHKFRSLLTVSSISIGAFAIVFISSLARSGFETMKRGIEELGGARLLFVVPKQPERAEVRALSYERGLTQADRDEVFGRMPHVEDFTLYAGFGKKDVLSDTGVKLQADLVAADERFLGFFNLPVARGRPLDAFDDERHAPLCWVGHGAAQKLWPDQDVLGRRLLVMGMRCQVMGEIAEIERPGINFGFNWNELVVVPRQHAADQLADVRFRSVIVVKTDDPGSNDVVKRIANALFSDRHHGIDDFRFLDFSGLIQKFFNVFALMQLIVGCLASVALLIGGIGIMNMMLVNVSERVREIGIRKALGARPRQISAQFLSEAALLSVTGGLIGVGLGMAVALAASLVITQFMKSWVGGISWLAVLAACLSSLGTGVFFGWFPARRAGALDPVEAMRR
jgi:putative ABC transport system permease protein